MKGKKKNENQKMKKLKTTKSTSIHKKKISFKRIRKIRQSFKRNERKT